MKMISWITKKLEPKPDFGLAAALHISSGAYSDPYHDRSACDTCKALGWTGRAPHRFELWCGEKGLRVDYAHYGDFLCEHPDGR